MKKINRVESNLIKSVHKYLLYLWLKGEMYNYCPFSHPFKDLLLIDINFPWSDNDMNCPICIDAFPEIVPETIPRRRTQCPCTTLVIDKDVLPVVADFLERNIITARTWSEAARYALKIIGKPSTVPEIWNVIIEFIHFKHNNENPKSSLRKAMIDHIIDAEIEMIEGQKIKGFYRPSKGLYSLIEWA